MKALVYHGPKELAWEEVPDIEIGPADVRIRVKAVGICGSDVHGYLGLTGRRNPPMIMGHEFSGVVEETGKSVSSVAAGDRVTVQPVQFCGTCSFCAQGLTNLCREKQLFGVLSCNGAMADCIRVPEHLIYPLPEQVSYEAGALVEAAAVAYRGVKTAGSLEGKRVLVIGAGTIGLLTASIARMRGAEQVFVSDLSDSRLKTAQAMGADVVMNPRNDNLKEIVADAAGGGVDIALEAVGITPSAQQSIELVKTGGTAVWIGNSSYMIEIPMQEVVTREIRILGSYLYTHQEFGEVLEMIGSGAMNLQPMISLSADMSEGPELFRRLAENPGDLIKVLLTNA